MAWVGAAVFVGIGLGGCAHPGGAPAAAASAASATAASASAASSATVGTLAASVTPRSVATPAAAVAPSPSPAFAAVIKDARQIPGTFPLWQKDDKVWIELAEKDFGAPLFLSPKLASGIGEAGVFGGLMASGRSGVGRPQLVEFRRVHNMVQLIGRNTAYVAAVGTPAARAVQAAFSPSLIGSTPVASAPHPERKSVLIEANALFLGDWLAIGAQLQRAYRQGYNFDGRNSAIVAVRGKPDVVVFEVQNHYATQSIASAQPGSPPGAPVPGTPDTLPDARSLFVKLHYSLSRLPAEPMATRAADPRIGFFTSTVNDFGDDLARTPRKRFVNRWRLQKKDPAAAISEPMAPITYWIDRNVPVKYRASITAGILEWNKAFERIGFKDAIAVKQQPDDADFDTLDMGVASVRWMTNASPSFGAVGPTHVDPRSGEILDADVSIESLSSRSLRSVRAQILGGDRRVDRTADHATDWAQLLQARDALNEARDPHAAHAALDACDHAEFAAEQLGYALDVLAARGELDPAGPETEAFVQAYLKDVTMHEIGHTLGLRHNFRASRVYGEAQLDSPAFGQTHALTGSVMEYAPINLNRPGAPPAVPFQTTLGPYDYWAIDYGYRPLAAADEPAELKRIAARSGEPELAFATDEDNLLGVDPESLVFDLGNDPLAFAAKRFDIARDLLKRLESRPLDPGQDYAVLRRSVSYALRDVARSAGALSRQIGGVRTLRDYPNTGRDPLAPVPAPLQRAALELLSTQVLSAQGLTVSPQLQRRLAPDFLERGDALANGEPGAIVTDYAPQQQVLEMQRALLAQLMNDGVAQRLLDSEGKAEATGANRAMHLAELYARLDADVWHELDVPLGDIAGPRRQLQREHLNRLVALLSRPSASGRADARALLRSQAQGLLTRLQKASERRGLSAEARAHLQDCRDILREVLTARLLRATA